MAAEWQVQPIRTPVKVGVNLSPSLLLTLCPTDYRRHVTETRLVTAAE